MLGFRTFRIPSNSNAPTLVDGSYVLVKTSAYRNELPLLQDHVVFRPPHDEAEQFVGRVIGLPGDRVAIENGIVYVNGTRLPEPYVRRDNVTEASSLRMDEIEVPGGMLFLLGDNRDETLDSRTFGPVRTGNVTGRIDASW